MVRVLRCGIPILLLTMSLSLAAQTTSSKPPKNLHRVGDHWTAYNPPDPATFPVGAKTHVIQRGDTLWDLARTFYGDPYLWPQLWEKNTYITDAHWIYPGDPLLVQGETSTGSMPSTDVADLDIFEDEQPLIRTEVANLPPPVPLGTAADVLCYGYLGGLDEPMSNRISSFEDSETRLIPFPGVTQVGSVTTGDILYIDGGTSTGLAPGETYLVIRAEKVVEHPVTGEPVGRHYDFRGKVRILCATEMQATAMVVDACDTIELGDSLRTVPLLPIPMARMTAPAGACTPPTGKSAGYIVNADGYEFAIGVGTLVEIDLGRDDFVQPGDFLTVYRPNVVEGQPRQVLGEIGVLTSEANTATAKVITMRYDMRVGDYVELK